ncbi:serine hydrolase domain-containing protein [Corynebacterium pseudodiphtheriticum]|nr:serine hydrolase domain-containing protein [Corynebacterium pseudodiphtheriticum]MDK8499695.1 serine hydrolase domain-containing protein [Corynebacterium pseudodiphtheriticum]MDK8583271.1 serine hydrolase domain-containing protein [Corynebacterium pseudodiphtheriticum]MDK8760642.1 serine hydrolase domain-containing protein [Corynebacterium pseudodiphtheriticum]MDK8838920.1 serine hydrolase domain-containing protein [Corynebacterium pseudodiphtheriticum]
MTSFEKIADWPVDNVAAALVRDGELAHTLGDDEHVFAVASVTKPVAAYGFAMAVEEGVFEWDTPVGPEGSTVRHLLAHASGIGKDAANPDRAPEDRRIYSSAGFEVLQEKLEEETGMDFAEYLKLGLFEPLGMNNTVLKGSSGYALETTVADLARFAQEVLEPSLLDPSTVKEMLTPQFADLRGIVPGYGMQKPCVWGLGFEIHGTKDPHWMGAALPDNAVGHFGMYGSYMWLLPDEKIALLALTDKDFGEWAKPLWAETNDAIWQELQG